MSSPEQVSRKRGRLPSVQDQVETFDIVQPLSSPQISPSLGGQSPFGGTELSGTSAAPTHFSPPGFTSAPSQGKNSPQGSAASSAPKTKPKPLPGSKRGTPSASFRNVSACNRCRVRKNRCDQRLPACEACEKVGAKCVGWDPFLGRAVPRSYVYFLESRITYLEELLENNEIEFSPAEDLSSVSGPTIRKENNNKDGSRSPSGSQDEERSPAAAKSNASPPKLKHEESDDSKMDNLASNIGMVSVKGASDSRYSGTTSGISFAKVVLHAVKSTVSRRNSEQLPGSSDGQRRMSIAAGPSTMRDSVFGLYTKSTTKEAPFPDKELGLKLVDLYFEHTNPQIPTLHRGDFMALFERVYTPNHDRTPKESYLLNIVFAIGAGTIFSREEKETNDVQSASTEHTTRGPSKKAKLSGVQQQPEEYHAAAIVHLERFLGSSTSDGYGGGLEELQAVLLLAGFALLRPVAPGLWYIVGVASRLAVDLGLHHEDGSDLTQSHAEVGFGLGEGNYVTGIGTAELNQNEIGRRQWVRDLRRRLWWCTYSLDRLVGTVVGRPFTISDQVVTTSFLSMKDDQYITTTGFLKPPSRNPPSYKLIARHYIRLRLLQSEIIQVLQYQSAQKAFRNKHPSEMDPYIHTDLKSPFLENFMSFGSWRKDMDRRLWLWREAAPAKEQTGVSFNPQFLELNYWQAVILLYRQSVATPEALAAEESNVKDGIGSPHGVDMAPEEDEDEEFVYAKIAEAGQKVLKIYRHLHRMHMVNYTYLATHHLFIAGISFLYAIWYSRVVRTYLSLDEVDNTILGALSVLEDLTTVCPPAKSCKDAFDRMSRTVLQVAQATTGFGPQAAAFIGHPAGQYGSPSPTSAPRGAMPPTSAPTNELLQLQQQQLTSAPRYRFETELGDLFADDTFSDTSSVMGASWDQLPPSFNVNNQDLSFLEEYTFAGSSDGNTLGLSSLASNDGANMISNFQPWNLGGIDGTHDWSDGNSMDFFGTYFFGSGNGGPGENN